MIIDFLTFHGVVNRMLKRIFGPKKGSSRRLEKVAERVRNNTENVTYSKL
jgi:hypothetical protein